MEKFNGETINVGVIGARFGMTHIQALLQDPGTLLLKTVCDLDAQKLENVKNELHGKQVTLTQNYHELLEDPEIDAVCLSVPHHLHQKLAEEAAAAGKHIMIDKPLARTEEEGKAIVEAVRKYDIQGMVAFNFRFSPLYQTIQKHISENSIGDVLLVISRHDQRFLHPVDSSWRNSESIGGGAVIGSGVHNIDFMRFCLGDPEEVYACGVNDSQRLDAEAGAAVIFRYANGAIVNFFCNWCKSSRAESPTQVFGEWEFYGRNGELRRLLNGDLCISRLDDSVEKLSVAENASFSNLWMHFEDCLRNGKTPLTDVEDALRTQRLIAITYESMRTGKPVRF